LVTTGDDFNFEAQLFADVDGEPPSFVLGVELLLILLFGELILIGEVFAKLLFPPELEP
jgi:hypothetical protein